MALLGEERHEVVDRRRSEHLAGLKRQLEGRGAQVREEDVQVVGVEARLLRPGAEQELRVVDDILVDGAPDAITTPTLVPARRPARPSCCQAPAMEPG